MKINKTKIDYIDTNKGPYVSGIIHTIEYEPVFFSKHFRFLKEDLGYNDRNLEDIKRQASIQIAEEIIDRMDMREEMDLNNTCINYMFTIRVLDDKKTRDFEKKIDELEHNLNIIYWDSKTKQVHTNIKALEAILARELVYVGSRYPLASIFRMRKFIKRDWNINVGQILKACMQLNDFDLSNPYILTDQCTGVDVHYLKNLVGNIVAEMESRRKNNEPISIDKGYAMTVIEKIFG